LFENEFTTDDIKKQKSSEQFSFFSLPFDL